MLLAAVLITAVVNLVPADAATGASFVPAETYPLANEMVSVATADVNLDSQPDALATVYGAGTVEVFLSNEDRTFTHHSTIPVRPGPISVALGDLNGDRNPDAVIGYGGTQITVLLGHGDGSFATPVDYGPTRFSSSWVHIGDVDGDSVPDVVAGDATVFRGQGDGTFHFAGKRHPSGLVTAVDDVNGDGADDIVVIDWAHPQGILTVVTSAGQRPVSYTLPLFPSWARLADVNRDGELDVVAGGVHETNGRGRIAVLTGRGDGTFMARSERLVGHALSDGQMTDFDRDGRVDLVVVGDNPGGNDASVWLLRGKGDGTFAAAGRYGPIGWASGKASLAVSDVNQDDWTDVVVSSRRSFNVLLNVPTCQGKRATVWRGGSDKGGYYIDGTNGDDVIVGTVNNDVIWGGRGNDVICTGAGNDEINTGGGDDWVDAGSGNDHIFAWSTVPGPDGTADVYRSPDWRMTAYGGPGNDVLDGTPGADRLHGGKGRDLLDGWEGTDRCDGGTGADTFRNCETRRG